MTSRAWTFTSYKEDINLLQEKIKYAVYQREICPTTGREHWQGYFQAKSPIRFKSAKAIVNDDSAHVEKAVASPEKNREYCTKEDCRKPGTMPVEIGEMPKGQGHR